MSFSVRKAAKEDAHTVAAMALKIWHSAPLEELASEFSRMAESASQAVYLITQGDSICGFAQCGLRYDYVEGTHSSPVGYLEGIYVEPEYRQRGCANILLHACEDWSREQGCSEFASDCELGNQESLHFHLHVGFREANRIICFTKKL